MWIKSENSEPTQPLEVEQFPNGYIVRRDFKFIEAVEEDEDFVIPAHWEYEEWQMTADQYQIWLNQQADIDFLSMENEFLESDLEQAKADIDFLTMESEYLDGENEQNRADIDYILMMIDEE